MPSCRGGTRAVREHPPPILRRRVAYLAGATGFARRMNVTLFRMCRPMVDCSRFLEGYSAYRDGELDDVVRAQFEAHRSECSSCARYDRVIRKGVELYLRCPEVTPSEDFLPRLQHRLYHIDEEMRAPARNSSGAQAAVTLALAASIAAIAWFPTTQSKERMIELPAVAARAPLPPPAPMRIETRPFYLPPPLGLDGWGAQDLLGQPPSDLFFRSAASDFRVQSVLQQ
jgi:hypothetical protein